MKTAILMLFALVVVGLLAQLAKRKSADRRNGPDGLIAKKVALTAREQSMYFRLQEVLDGHILFSQVPFSALLKARTQQDRNRFDRKVADFVIFNKSFEVIVVIELDDASHKNREKQDQARQSLLTNAGYKVIRYNNVPDANILEKDLAGLRQKVANTLKTA